ncbi:MAG: hypothetical protein OJJ21_07290 [Ferrovibrio sp.]|uniref:hypothetical protein n=1 Tax=Ferrovibrio sp. TaxID=1917215 RepID=UPI0026229128|nr:hypothetical protein [Ferrovibrio sp.]MCW0233385.1 hypothetical protein [Ferrovibrio sp.]
MTFQHQMSPKSPDPTALPAPVAEQLAALALRRGRPLLIVDADEVLFYFMRGLERFLESRNLYFDWASYALHGNIRQRADNAPVAAEILHPLLQRFFAEATEELEPVDGAAQALAVLSETAQVVVLSNVPMPARAARLRALARHGMDFPLIANTGPKGPAVAVLLRQVMAPAVFIDDIPHNHKSVAELAPATHRLHYIADTRLAALLGPAPDCHHRAETWPDMQQHIQALLTQT